MDSSPSTSLPDIATAPPAADVAELVAAEPDSAVAPPVADDLHAGQKRRRPDDSTPSDAYEAPSRALSFVPGSLIGKNAELVSQARVVAADLGADFDTPAAVQLVARYERAVAEMAIKAAASRAAAIVAPGDAATVQQAAQQEEALSNLRKRLEESRTDMDAQFKRNLRDEIVRVTLQVGVVLPAPLPLVRIFALAVLYRMMTPMLAAPHLWRPKCSLCCRLACDVPSAAMRTRRSSCLSTAAATSCAQSAGPLL